MKSFLIPTLGFALALGCSTAHATLIGDTITLTHYYPAIGPGNTVGSATVTVSAGLLDKFDTTPNYIANPEAFSIAVDFTQTAGYSGGPGVFNGLVVTGIDWTVTGVSFNTNLGAGFAPGRINVFDSGHSVSVNWEGLNFTPNSFFDIFFELTPPGNPTPDSGATATLLGLAVLGLVAVRRRMA